MNKRRKTYPRQLYHQVEVWAGITTNPRLSCPNNELGSSLHRWLQNVFFFNFLLFLFNFDILDKYILLNQSCWPMSLPTTMLAGVVADKNISKMSTCSFQVLFDIGEIYRMICHIVICVYYKKLLCSPTPCSLVAPMILSDNVL